MSFVEKVTTEKGEKPRYQREAATLFCAFEKASVDTKPSVFKVQFTRFSLPISQIGLSDDALNEVLKRCGGVGAQVDKDWDGMAMPKAPLYWQKDAETLHMTLRGKHLKFPTYQMIVDYKKHNPEPGTRENALVRA